MILDSRACEALRRAALAGEVLPASLEAFDQFTLPGLMEMLATAIDMSADNPFLLHFQRPRQTHTTAVSSCWQVWNEDEPASLETDIHGTRKLEFYRLRAREDQINARHQLYRERFVRSLKSAGFAKEFAYALAGALGEMTDNVVQHSRSDLGEFTGLAGYHVCHGYMAFSVVDIGRGVLASLTSSPTWQHLRTPTDALRAAVCENASSRVDHPAGDGFRTLFRSLTDRNGLLRFRSDTALLTLGDGGHHRQGIEMSSPALSGLQLSVCCALIGIAEERVIEIS